MTGSPYDITGSQRGVPMLMKCWSTVHDGGPTFHQHWLNATSSLGVLSPISNGSFSFPHHCPFDPCPPHMISFKVTVKIDDRSGLSLSGRFIAQLVAATIRCSLCISSQRWPITTGRGYMFAGGSTLAKLGRCLGFWHNAVSLMLT